MHAPSAGNGGTIGVVPQRPGQPAQAHGAFGEAIKSYRGAQRPGKPFGISREGLAHEWGFSVNTIHKWEQGEAVPGSLAAEKIRSVAPSFVWPTQDQMDVLARKLAKKRAARRALRADVVDISHRARSRRASHP